MKATITGQAQQIVQTRKEKSGRLQGDNPKIGIRPTIDGRQGGVRESLEDQTMRMGLNLATFYRRI